jgi:hypothetical protein
MRNFFLILFTAVIALQSCKKGSITETAPGGKQFAQMPSSGPGNTFSTISGDTPEDEDNSDDDFDFDFEEDDDDDFGGDTGGSSQKRIDYKGSEHKNFSVTCASGSDYYAVSASNSSPSFTCTIYFKSKPTSSSIYSVEEITGPTPSSSSSVFLVVTDSGKSLIASIGTVSVTLNGGKVSVNFTNIYVEDESSEESISGEFACP